LMRFQVLQLTSSSTDMCRAFCCPVVPGGVPQTPTYTPNAEHSGLHWQNNLAQTRSHSFELQRTKRHCSGISQPSILLQQQHYTVIH
jgi:hypothetical protein